MIIRKVTLSNFGIYGSECTFDLTPIPVGNFNRPIILFNGKNGVGKTTLVEAIKLCLHGPMSLGSRIGQAEYNDYLSSRIHHPLDHQVVPDQASIELLFDYVSLGRKHTYCIKRSWSQVGGGVSLLLDVSEDEAPLSLDMEQTEGFLRELVPPGVADLFFFDGEKLQTLAEDDTSSDLLAESVRSLLGLNLVEQLQKDLDVYITRQMSHDKANLHTPLSELTERLAELDLNREAIQVERQSILKAISNKKRTIARQEQKIASEGMGFAKQLEEKKTAKQQLEATIEAQHRYIQELCSGLAPFAIAPQVCQAVAQRLEVEHEYEQWATSQQVLNEQLGKISGAIASPDFWADIGMNTDKRLQRKLFNQIKAVLALEDRPVTEPDEIVHHVSERDRHMLLTWIEQTQTEIPAKFCEAIERLNDWEAKLDQLEHDLLLAPADERLRPLVEIFNSLNQELGGLQQKERELGEQLQRLDYEIEQANHQLHRLREQATAQEKHGQRIQLASKTQTALEEYVVELASIKLAILEKAIASRFNGLCRKDALIDSIKIDPSVFSMILYRSGLPMERKLLSAGEKQLLAISTMWALREVSGVPMPVIIDTPLGRLDSDHRLSMVRNYFPRASHQVILLATETEMDSEILTKLAPAVSLTYQLDYDPTTGATVVTQKRGE